MEDRLLVLLKKRELDLFDVFDGNTFEEAVDMLLQFCTPFEGDFQKFEIEYSYFLDEPRPEVYLKSYRYETDKEYDKRMKYIIKSKEEKAEHKAKLKVKKEQDELKEYKRLHKKYGNK